MTIKIHHSAKISKMSDIEESVKGSNIIIEKNVIIDSFVKIKPAGGYGDFHIGENSVINSGCVFYTGNGINIGKYVAIAGNCTFAPTNHKYNKKDVKIMDQGFLASKGGIFVGNDVWIGANTVILDGSVIPDGCVIGANSLVRSKLEAYNIYAGFPLKRIGERE